MKKQYIRAAAEVVIDVLLSELIDVKKGAIREIIDDYPYIRTLEGEEYEKAIKAIRDKVRGEFDYIHEVWVRGDLD